MEKLELVLRYAQIDNQAKAITNAMTMAMTGIYCVGVITRAMTIRLYAQ